MDGARSDHRSLRESQDRRTRVAIVASLVLHVVLLVLVFRLHLFKAPRPFASPEIVTVHQILRIAHKPRVVERPVVAAHPRPITRAAPRPQTAPHVTRKPVIPKSIVPTLAPERPIAAPPHAPARIATRPAPHAVHVPVSSGATAVPAPQAKSRLSGAQIARIEGDLSNSIAQDRAGIDPLRAEPGAVATPKHFTPDFSGLTASIDHEHGLCDPIKDWTEDGWNYYYVACNVQTESGLSKRESVPWPIRFDPSDDPFNGTAHRNMPVAMPLPGWHLPPGETVSDGLREYAHEHGVEL